MGHKNLKFSIIVTAYTLERRDDIAELLDSIRAQTYRNIETVFVAERSPELYEAVKEMGRDMPTLKVIYHDGEPGISAARNRGIREASGDIIAFTDDDAVLFPQWAEASVKAYAADDDIIGLTGPILPQWEDPSMAWFPREFYWIFACTHYDWQEPHEVRNGYGTNISFRREAFTSGGLFSPHLGSERGGAKGQQKTTAEEMELSLRIRHTTGKRIVYHPGAAIHHKVHRFRLTGRYVRQRAYIEGCSKMFIKKLFKGNLKKEVVLDTEYALLKRICLRLFPSIIKDFFTHPVLGWRRFSVTTTVLAAVAAGYCAYAFKSP